MTRSKRSRRSKSDCDSSRPCIEAGLGGDQLREQLAELAKLDQAGVRIVMKIAFGKRSQPHELSVVSL